MTAQLITTLFQNITAQLSQVLDSNYDKRSAFTRSIKVFLMSFPEYSVNSFGVYSLKFNEFVQQMQELYDYRPTQDELEKTIGTVNNELDHLNISLTVGVKRFKGRDQAVNPSISVRIGVQQSARIPLNTNSEIQSNVKYSLEMSFNSFRKLVKDNLPINVRLAADQWVDDSEEVFNLRLKPQEIHCEGFEDWCVFGRGVQLLVRIEFTSSEPNWMFTREAISKYQLQTILLMIENRVKVCRTSRVGTGHRSAANKTKISYINGKVVPLSDQVFWSQPNTLDTVLQRIRRLEVTGRTGYSSTMKTSVKFCDLQIGNDSFDEFEDSVCLCSEWCNWNAFFHFNPIYRFLTVRHNQLFLKYRLNIPDIYFFVTTTVLFNAEQGLPINATIPKTPVLQLMTNAYDYKKRFHHNYVLQNMIHLIQYQRSHPNYVLMNGISYHYLRYDLDISQHYIHLDPKPFADVCIENLITTENMIYDLHHSCGLMTDLVRPANKRNWFTDYDTICRNKYCDFLELSVDQLLINKHWGYDYLFSEDFEYSSVLCKTLSDLEIKTIREQVLKKVVSDNPYNTRVFCNHYMYLFASMNKFIQRTDQTLPTARNAKPLEDIYEAFANLDDILINAFSHRRKLEFTFEQTLSERQLENQKKEFTVFHTLKMYSNFFGIQTKWIQYLLLMNRKQVNPEVQVCDRYAVIWMYDINEHQFRSQYPNETLFNISDDMVNSFKEFYLNYWKRASYEVKPYPTVRQVYYDSAQIQYQRLYYWLKNNGNSNVRFTAIMNALDTTISNINISSENIFNTYLLPSIEVLSKRYEYFAEVMDYLVYYLVKANCVMIYSTIGTLLKQCHSLQIKDLVKNKIGLMMCKPGWVQMFSTLSSAFDFVDQIKASYIVFDDELDRISKTLFQTKHSIKQIYRQFYKKLGYEWVRDIKYMYAIAGTDLSQLLCLHLISGFAFFATLWQYFRREFCKIRKNSVELVSRTPDPQNPHQVIFTACRRGCFQYLKDRNAIQTGQPFDTNYWNNTLRAMFAALDQMTGQQLNIVL